MSRLTLHPRAWYAMECVFSADERHHSPVWIERVTPLGSGAGLLELAFYHANYPEGMRQKCYRLRVLHRTAHYLLALRAEPGAGQAGEHTPILFFPITPAWLGQHLPELRNEPTDSATLATKLDRATGRVPSPC